MSICTAHLIARTGRELEFDTSNISLYTVTKPTTYAVKLVFCPTEVRRIDTQADHLRTLATIVRRKWRHVSTRTWAGPMIPPSIPPLQPVAAVVRGGRRASARRTKVSAIRMHRPVPSTMVSGLAGRLGAAAARTKTIKPCPGQTHATGRPGRVGGRLRPPGAHRPSRTAVVRGREPPAGSMAGPSSRPRRGHIQQ